VLNVAGHRLGTMEIESALVAHPRVAEAAVVSKPHDIKGESVFAYVVLNGERPEESAAAAALTNELRAWVADQLSPIAKPDEIRLSDNLPKTRSGKIMRRLLRSIARGEEITQDVSTLENPAILDQLRGLPQPAGAAKPARSTKAASQSKRVMRVEPVKRLKRVKPEKAVKTVKRVQRAKPAKRRVAAARENPVAVRKGKKRGSAAQARRKPRGKK
jgi:hypothetical protein